MIDSWYFLLLLLSEFVVFENVRPDKI